MISRQAPKGSPRWDLGTNNTERLHIVAQHVGLGLLTLCSQHLRCCAYTFSQYERYTLYRRVASSNPSLMELNTN